MCKKCFKISLSIVFTLSAVPAGAATIAINTTSQRSAISPHIYGINQELSGSENITAIGISGEYAFFMARDFNPAARLLHLTKFMDFGII